MHKHMLRALGLSLLAALGLMAFAAAGAQAEALAGVAGKIKILKVDATAGTAVTGKQEGAGTLLVPGLSTEFVCQKVKVVEGKVLSGAKGEGLGKVLYEECVAWGTKKNAAGEQELTTILPCELLEDESPFTKGGIVATALLLVVLHEGDTYILAEGDPKEKAFGSILTTTPGECPLPKLVEVKGSVVFQAITGDLALGQPEVKEILVEAKKSISALFTDKLFYGINESFIDGKALLSLPSGCTWGLI